MGVVQMARRVLQEWTASRLCPTIPSISAGPANRIWMRPPVEKLKINVDASLHGDGRSVGGGMGMRM